MITSREKRAHFRTIIPVLLFLVSMFLSCRTRRGPRDQSSRPKTPEELREKADHPRSASRNPKFWNVRVNVERAETSMIRQHSHAINWELQSKNVRVEGGKKVLPNNGLRVGISTKNVSAELRIQEQTRRTRRFNSSTLTVLNGHSAMLQLQRQEPQQIRINVYGPRGGTVVDTYHLRVTGMALRIRPEIIDRGPAMDLHITPVLARPSGNGVVIDRLQTRIRVRDGHSILLGGTSGSSSSFGSTLFSAAGSRKSRDSVWIVTPKILN